MKNIKNALSSKFVYLILFLSIFFVNSAHARFLYLEAWGEMYQSSTSDDAAGCQLCHKSSLVGGDGWNEYGQAVRSGLGGNTLVDKAAIKIEFGAVEDIDSDGDPTVATNIDEITSNTQPGWTEGPGNSIYFKNDDIVEQSPPSELTTPLDPEITINPDIGVSPGSLDFSNIVNTTVTETLTVTNTGDDDLVISNISSCPNSSTFTEYSFLPPVSPIVTPNSSAFIQVSYTPIDIGYDRGCLRIISNDLDQPQLDIPLTGQGLDVNGGLIDINIETFTVSSDAEVGSSAITISLSGSNTGNVNGNVKATVTGSLSGTEIYSEEIIFDSGLGVPQGFPDYFPASAGEILWQAIVDDQDQNTDNDIANSSTIVTSSALADPIPESIQSSSTSVAFETVASGLIAPNYATYAPGIPDQLYVVDQPGQIWRINLNTRIRYPFMDVSHLLVSLGIFGPGSFDERGLLGLAFHPDYMNPANGLIYTYTSEPVSANPLPADFPLPTGIAADHQAVITEWEVTDHTVAGGYVDMTNDTTSGRRVLLRVDEPQFNHNGGAIAFGPDGLLYIGFGDGGGADDKDGQPFIGGLMLGHGVDGNGQDTSNPLGSILRIDPLGFDLTREYSIPSDNPFVGNPSDGLGEIYAYGLRNPFRISFDTKDGKLYAGDVGQNDIEEINIIVNGGNYGWNRKEGSFFFNPNGFYSGFVHNEDPGDLPLDLIDPLLQYDHDEGISVTAGFVYRGGLFKSLKGSFIFGDWSKSFSIPSGRLFHQYHTSSIREFVFSDRESLGLFIHGFGQDHDGEVYVIGNKTGTPFKNANAVATGQVLKMIPGSKVKGGGKK